MFEFEADMTHPVVEWMLSSGFHVKTEFVSPWGVCDVVGAKFNEGHVSRRLNLGQKRAVTSITRAALLLQIPDIVSGGTVTIEELANECAPAVSKEMVAKEVERLIQDKFVITDEGRLQKLNGWIPIQDSLVAVELKLRRVEEALLQAKSNVGFANESFVGLPEDVALRLHQNTGRRNEFLASGVGLIAVSSYSCEILIPAKKFYQEEGAAAQMYSVEKFWKLHLKGNSTLRAPRPPRGA